MQTINVSTMFNGVHHWKDAPDAVAFLRNEHRHFFYVNVTFEVHHADRYLEFLIVKNFIDGLIISQFGEYHPDLPNTRQLGERSCEMIAKVLYDLIEAVYPTVQSVSVSEDGENGGSYPC